MNALLPLTVAVPIAGAAVSVLVRGSLVAQRVVTFLITIGLLAVGVVFVVLTAPGAVLVEQVGGWPAGVAIPFAVDPFAALMLTAAVLTVVVCVWFAAASGHDAHPLFHPLTLVLTAGTVNAFLTADLFNLFVAFEVMLIASYVLLVLRADRESVRAGAVYVTVSLLASALFVIAVAFTYGLTGTVNFAVLATRVERFGALIIPGALLLVAFGVKAALVPAHGWLARSYPSAPSAVTALFSGLLTKVGVYALYRVYTLLFAEVPGMRGAALVAAGLSMVIGVFGAVGRDSLRQILAFHMTSQMGYMIMGLGLLGVPGLTAGIFFLLHQIVVKTSLFLAAGAIERVEGSGRLRDLGGMARRNAVLAVAFALSALSLAGLPPLSGFFGKLLLVRAAFEAGQHLIGAVAVIVSFFTLLSMVKIWLGTFWGEDPFPSRPRRPAGQLAPVAGGSGDDRPPLPDDVTDAGVVEDASEGAGDGDATHVAPPLRPASRAALIGPALTLAIVSLAAGLAGEGLYQLSETAGELMTDTSVYVEAVLGDPTGTDAP